MYPNTKQLKHKLLPAEISILFVRILYTNKYFGMD